MGRAELVNRAVRIVVDLLYKLAASDAVQQSPCRCILGEDENAFRMGKINRFKLILCSSSIGLTANARN